MSHRERILGTARELTVRSGSVPSMDAIAAAAKVSKGGFTHHFRTRAALLEGLAQQAIEEMDEALLAAAERGEVVKTWLRRSTSRDEAVLFRALLMSFADLGDDAAELLDRAAAASERWERLLDAELHDPVAASVVRLVGDGLVMDMLTNPRKRPSVDPVLAWLERRETPT